jgi:1,2-dihydroxy-3-keto-5-methylthiopentene dioxygenase
MLAYWLNEEHPSDASQALDAATLEANDVTYRALPVAGHEPALDAFMQAHGYVTRDEVQLHAGTPNLAAILAKFEAEHLHTDDEVRYVLEGEGIFDIRSKDDRWMRVIVEVGDLISVPKDRHHRFLLTEKNAIRCARLFVDASGWTPHYRAKA